MRATEPFNHDLEWRGGGRRPVWWEWCNQQIFARAVRFWKEFLLLLPSLTGFPKSTSWNPILIWRIEKHSQHKQQIMEMMVQQNNPLVLHQQQQQQLQRRRLAYIPIERSNFTGEYVICRSRGWWGRCVISTPVFLLYINWLNKARKQNRFFDKNILFCFVRFCSNVWGAPFVPGRVESLLFSHLIALLPRMTEPERGVFAINSLETPSRV